MRELDFEHEATNLAEVARNLRVAGLEAVVPTPLPGLVSTRALVMTCAETSSGITRLQPDAHTAVILCLQPATPLQPPPGSLKDSRSLMSMPWPRTASTARR